MFVPRPASKLTPDTPNPKMRSMSASYVVHPGPTPVLGFRGPGLNHASKPIHSAQPTPPMGG